MMKLMKSLRYPPPFPSLPFPPTLSLEFDSTSPSPPPDPQEDVNDECNNYGTVRAIVIPRPSGSSVDDEEKSVGNIFVSFTSPEAATKAKNALSGRTYDGKSVVAVFYPEKLFEQKVRPSSPLPSPALSSLTDLLSDLLPALRFLLRSVRSGGLSRCRIARPLPLPSDCRWLIQHPPRHSFLSISIDSHPDRTISSSLTSLTVQLLVLKISNKLEHLDELGGGIF
jgi:hypothetical protein